MPTRDEKLKAAMQVLGAKHVLHPSHHVPRRERRVDPSAVDVRRTFDRLQPGWNQPECAAVIQLSSRR